MRVVLQDPSMVRGGTADKVLHIGRDIPLDPLACGRGYRRRGRDGTGVGWFIIEGHVVLGPRRSYTSATYLPAYGVLVLSLNPVIIIQFEICIDDYILVRKWEEVEFYQRRIFPPTRRTGVPQHQCRG